jgi:hypothetical protein
MSQQRINLGENVFIAYYEDGLFWQLSENVTIDGRTDSPPVCSFGLGAHQPDRGLSLGIDGEESTCSPGLAYTVPGCFSAFYP